MSKYPQTLLSCPIAQDGDRSAVPVTALEAGTGRLSQEEGWGKWNSLPIGEGGIPPKRDDFNSVLYLLSSFLVWYQQGGLMNYSTTLDYEPGNEVLVGKVKYRCLKANGPSSTVKSPVDSANSAYWSNQDAGEVRYDKAQSLSTLEQAQARKNIDVQSTGEVAKQLADAINGFVAFNKAQSLSDDQKAQARTNIGVTSSGDMNDAIEEAVAGVVKYTPQSLNTNQQAQARKNIAAAPVASPNFTGTPTVPTPASGDSSQQVANTAWVKTAISASAFVKYTPQSLNTNQQAQARKNIDVQSTGEVAKQLADAINGFVAFNKAQSLSDDQKAQARTNIGVTSSGDMNDAIEEAVAGVVKYTPQSLNTNQQAQARKNIAAAPVASPNFTGTPTVPTPASGDSSQQVANTAWVKTAISASASEDYVIETYRSGSTWYRKWKSGFIEQHGTIGGGSGTAQFVTPFQYPDSVSLQLTATGGGHPDDCYTIAKVVNGSSFSYNIRRFNGGNWYAAGY